MPRGRGAIKDFRTLKKAFILTIESIKYPNYKYLLAGAKLMDANCHKKQILSPLRYPGGKGVFTPYFIDLIRQNGLTGCRYFEPFAGGAGVALGLLSAQAVSEIILNDADYHIYCFWKAVTDHNQKFADQILSIPLNIAEWRRQKEIYREPSKHSVFEVAFSTFYLNRCNRSGIISGAGPIGGYEQKGKWLLDVRFKRDFLAERILKIGKLRKNIVVHNMDAIDFLQSQLTSKIADTLVYCDPPYVSAGTRLYLKFYHDDDHKKLAEYFVAQQELKWIVSYDDNPLIRELYGSCQMWLFSLGYSVQNKQKGFELLIAPQEMLIPDQTASYSAKWKLHSQLGNNKISPEMYA